MPEEVRAERPAVEAGQRTQLDVEGADWAQHTHSENRAFMLSIKRVLDAAGISYTVYSGREWPQFFGDNFTEFWRAPLIYAHYDLVPSLYDFTGSAKYGGWERAAGANHR